MHAGEISNLLVKIARELNLAFEDLLVDGHGVVVVKWIDAGDHLVGEDAEGPPVDRLAVAFVEEDLWGEVLRGTTERVCARLAVLCEAEIGQFEVALIVDKDILGLQITVDDVQRVQVFEHEGDLS